MIGIFVGFLSLCGAKITIILYVTKKFQLFFSVIRLFMYDKPVKNLDLGRVLCTERHRNLCLTNSIGDKGWHRDGNNYSR